MNRPCTVLCILDGVGWGRRDEGDAVALARTPQLDALMAHNPWCLLTAHGTAVGMPSDDDMGNSEVGHNAMGAGRVFAQGAALVERALASGALWSAPAWTAAVAAAASGGTLHLIGLLSDGGVHAHIRHLLAIIAQASAEGVDRLRLHVLTDGRDVEARSALRFLATVEAALAQTGRDYAIASGGGRMVITMDRYEADWDMVARGWATHVGAQGRRFAAAAEAVQTFYDEDPKVDDQWLPAFVIGDYAGMADGDAVLFLNFRGDRAIEISKAFDAGPAFDRAHFRRDPHPAVFFAGMMEYDGDAKVPAHFLVSPPVIEDTVAEHLSANGRATYAVSETQKFGHVTYFFNGNRTAVPVGEVQEQVESDRLPFDQAPAMKAREITDKAIAALRSQRFDHLRLNLANGDMVGHTGKLAETIEAIEAVDACLGALAAACAELGAILLVTADHGNADEMFMIDKKKGTLLRGPDGQPKPCSSHSCNPVPFVLVDPRGEAQLSVPVGENAGSIARIGATVLHLCGITPPASYLPSLVAP